jgi:predicted ribosome-associated RNA-binding protein Tma20
MKEIASLKSELDNKNKLLKKSTKVNDNIKAEKNILSEKHMKEITEHNEKLKTLIEKNNSLLFYVSQHQYRTLFIIKSF